MASIAHSQPQTAETARDAERGLFFFLANLPALDLVNTEPLLRRRPRELLATPADAARWWGVARQCYPDLPAVRGAPAEPPLDTAGLAAIKRLRAALRGIFSAILDATPPSAADVEQLNAALATTHQALEVQPSGATQVVYQVTGGATGSILVPLALSASAWLQDGDRTRLHRCTNSGCSLLFYDTTRSATRRWCCIACRDRVRAAQRYHGHT